MDTPSLSAAVVEDCGAALQKGALFGGRGWECKREGEERSREKCVTEKRANVRATLAQSERKGGRQAGICSGGTLFRPGRILFRSGRILFRSDGILYRSGRI